MEYKIRKYIPTDKERLILCIKELREHLMLLNPNRRKDIPKLLYERIMNKIENKLKEKKAIVFVAELNSKIIGYIYGQIKIPTEDELMEFENIRIGEVVDLFIFPEYQKKGIGSSLLAKIEKFFEKQNCKIVNLIVLNSNSEATRFYSKKGYQNVSLEMEKKLDK